MRVVIIGLGSIAKKHIAALKHIVPQIEIYALRSSSTASPVDGVQSIFNFSDITSIQPDFVIISNPTAEHFETIKKLRDIRVPLFIEKPLFDQITDDQEEVCGFFEKHNIQTYVACNLRFLDCLIAMKKILEQVKINEVNVYCGSYLPEWRPGVDFRTVYSANKEMGGGVHIDLIHELDYVYWMFGKPQTTHALFANKSTLNISSYDYANYSWSYAHFTANVVLNYYRRDSKRTLEILTDNETFLVDLLQNRIYRNGALFFQSNQKIADTYTAQMNFFLDQIRAQKISFNSITEAHLILKLCLEG